MAAVTNRPVSLIFLEVIDVLIDCASEELENQVDEEEKRLQDLYPDQPYSSSLFRKRALTHFFSRDALGHLKSLAHRTNESALFIISSKWREGIDIEVLRNFVFADVFFRDLILDKTPDPDDEKDSGYGFILGSYKGRAIDCSLREHHKVWKPKSIVIIDSHDSDIKARFPRQFHHVTKGLFSEKDASSCAYILDNIPFSEDSFPSEEAVEMARFNQRECYLGFF